MPNHFYTPSFIVENHKESGSDETPSNFTNENINAPILRKRFSNAKKSIIIA